MVLSLSFLFYLSSPFGTLRSTTQEPKNSWDWSSNTHNINFYTLLESILYKLVSLWVNSPIPVLLSLLESVPYWIFNDILIIIESSPFKISFQFRKEEETTSGQIRGAERMYQRNVVFCSVFN